MAEQPARGPEDNYVSPDDLAKSEPHADTRYNTWTKQDPYVKNAKFTGGKK